MQGNGTKLVVISTARLLIKVHLHLHNVGPRPCTPVVSLSVILRLSNDVSSPPRNIDNSSPISACALPPNCRCAPLTIDLQRAGNGLTNNTCDVVTGTAEKAPRSNAEPHQLRQPLPLAPPQVGRWDRRIYGDPMPPLRKPGMCAHQRFQDLISPVRPAPGPHTRYPPDFGDFSLGPQCARWNSLESVPV